LPEGVCDILLIQLLLKCIPNTQDNGSGGVLRTLEKFFHQQVAIGIIDNDKDLQKHKASYFTEFVFQRKENDLILKKHLKRDNYIIILAPALEKFILKAAIQSGIPQQEIPFSEERLKQLSKSRKAEKDEILKNFLNRIITKKSPGTETLKAWIREILGDE
jgi:hypothetical protein